MKIIPLDGWDAPGNHDSFRTPRDLGSLISQVKLLPGIATQDYTGIPSMIKLFAEKCLYGERPIYVVKGLHQRWGNNPQPHLRVRFYYSVGPNLTQTSIDMHIQLSEEASTWSEGDYCWTTVGITYVVGETTKQSWPAVYSQEVGNIQESGRNRQGYRYRRRMSVGCLPPPVAAPVGGAVG
jgi:hypothetical protein